ncbi:hypothetical protein Kpol_1035p7 [Vanderwaltozyma polyspora DSM 70294]|uniref:Lysophospholipid acyltransferase n=1 Tax=Vanderwaltozyma polyspora (strain ATCC 22028 / DSM 70294 / BCRC 21397 / CBS 2163 / NBRC 10782 / NRRL Y-8283 / UCD 57-17) TaxID=436907 RepID=A7TKH3_VANPO|nr:uncharacterized protein Kpol_1035p7 [Vanderwaltozyma polyspora DSM 70294]EDO17195.1 hypothetical protein Kpol_1035p7 [Vanderwaltozyma polyspora DSM 70294]
MFVIVEGVILYLSVVSNIEPSLVKYLICLVMSYFSNIVLVKIPLKYVGLRCLYIISVATFYLLVVLRSLDSFLILVKNTLVTFLLTRWMASKYMPFVNFFLIMGNLAIHNIYNYFYPPTMKFDTTAIHMILVIKLTSFGWSYFDGTSAKPESLSVYKRSKAVKKHPSLLQFMAYTFFYPTLLTGPSIDYIEFDDWLTGNIFKDYPTSNLAYVPHNWKLSLKKLIKGLVFLLLAGISKTVISEDKLNSKKAFLDRSFIYKIHYLYLLGFAFRLKYYSAWTTAEGACISSGIAYNYYDKDSHSIVWDRMSNIDIWTFEAAQSSYVSIKSWNIKTNNWLKNYVYLRLCNDNEKPTFTATLITFAVSAFWHGINPCYYLTFLTGALYQNCGQYYRKYTRPVFLLGDRVTPSKYKWIYDFIGFYMVKLLFGYLMQPFILLDFSKALEVWSKVGYFGHICVVITYLLFKGPLSTSFKHKCLDHHPVAVSNRKQLNSDSHKLKTLPKIQIELGMKLGSQSQIYFGIPQKYIYEWTEILDEWDIFVNDYSEWKFQNGLELEEDNLVAAFFTFIEQFAESTSPIDPEFINRKKISFNVYSPSSSQNIIDLGID